MCLKALIGAEKDNFLFNFLFYLKECFMYFSNGLEGHGNTVLNQEESLYNYLGIRIAALLSSFLLFLLPPYFKILLIALYFWR